MIPLEAYLKTPLFFLVAGPCVVEDEEMPMNVASVIHRICRDEGIPYVFKASYRKANRTRVDSFTGIGDLKALRIIAEVGKTLDIPVITDVHTPAEAEMAASYADILQIPAFLCRQTDLLQAAAETGRAVNIKKGQFVSAAAMRYAVDKILNVNPDAFVALTERGSMFGYQDLVVDYRNIPWMQAHGVPVILDATHSLQQPNTAAGVSGGLPMLIDTISSAGIAAGVDGLFIETHPEPAKAKSDGANMLPLDQLEKLVRKWIRIKKSL
ncbi:MAG TPA: 3-deoxy-8-phosphooctulonate synthase [Bacteroidales bacterium]|nr:3-deoxy-8-phosphooctulonate synthase [Bacteroidales bacterium]HSA44398.1 3-deoxy-8-phosphooctulonate synthase [Bacteroidales bacterium]